jgi:D-alanyl-D-alanine carboxypeptidase
MKKFLLLTFVSFILVMGIKPSVVCAQQAPSITARSAVLYDCNTGRIIFAKMPDLRLPPASTIKLLTAMVAMDRLGLSDIITIQQFVNSIEPRKLNLRPGERYYVRDLIRAALMYSANDAAETLAAAAGGSRAGFARLMNAKARSIGCTNSNFVRASGLPAANQYSTSYDMALIMMEIQKYSFIVDTLKIRGISIRSMGGRRIYIKSHNRMLWNDPREVLGKTGWTRASSYCFVGHIRVDTRKVVVSMLGSNNLWADVKKLVDFPFGSVVRCSAPAKRKISPNNSVYRLQYALKKAGFNPGPTDGHYGNKTRYALIRFQKSHGLPATGYAGQLTWKKLKRYLN